MMQQFTCDSLSGLAKMLREKYDIRSKMIVRNFSDADLLVEEYEIIRINRLMLRHRRRCPRCQLQGSFAGSAVMRTRPITADLEPFSAAQA
jgi:hypothetical protein